MTYQHWKRYFEDNRSHFSDINWQEEDNLKDDEKELVSSSLQQFQRGENSEGKHLFAYAKTFPDPVYLECIRLFICEEQMHAKVLGSYMDKYSIPRIKGHWVDGVFRWLRKLAGIENTIAILLTAEIISKVYYAALKRATGSSILQKICGQILKDEDQHIAFQCFTLRFFYRGRSLAGRLLIRTLQFILMNGTIAIVWLYHNRVLKKGGHSLVTFWQTVLQVYFDCDAIIINKRKYNENTEILFP
ncbi:MAG: hypothetical protein WDO19_26205 [Bacteroidota bacterium]